MTMDNLHLICFTHVFSEILGEFQCAERERESEQKSAETAKVNGSEWKIDLEIPDVKEEKENPT